MKPYVGQVSVNGSIRFADKSLQECRRFLRAHGLEVKARIGWCNERRKLLGAIYFCGEGNGWEAAYWRSDAV